MEAPGLDFGGFWGAPGEVLEGPRLIFGMFLAVLWVPYLGTRAETCGQTFLLSFCQAFHI